MTHPSSLDLDFVALGAGRAEVALHVESCPACQAHVAQSKPTLEAAPAWAHPVRRPLWLRGGGLGFAVAAAAVLTLVVRPPPDEPLTRPKGQPSFAVWLIRGDSSSLWDGRSPLAPGDRLQLRLAGAGFTQVVVGVEQEGRWAPLYEGAVNPHGETQLPQSWLVDDRDPSMRLGVLLCDGLCPGDALAGIALERPRSATRWWSEFSFTVGSPR